MSALHSNRLLRTPGATRHPARALFNRSALLATVFSAAIALAQTVSTAAAPPKSIEALRAFFEQNCTRCHGLDGSGRDPHGKRLGGLDFIQATKAFRQMSGAASERELRFMSRTLRKGIFFGIVMPAWKDQLSPEDATLMVQEVLMKAEEGKHIRPEASQDQAEGQSLPAHRTKSLNELKAFYQQQCVRCHGTDGSAMAADGRPLAGKDFTQAARNYQARSGPPFERDIRTMIRTLREGIAMGITMPSWQGNLSEEDASVMVREVLLKAEKGKVIAP
jgi:mono/diheme cytochrome c family protein